MSNKEKLNAVETEKVTGGASEVQNEPTLQERFDAAGYVDMKCERCGKTFKFSKYILEKYKGRIGPGRTVMLCSECRGYHLC